MEKGICSCGGSVAMEWAVQLACATHKRHDSYTFMHSCNLASLAADIGRQLQLSDQQVWILDLASRVHDIGKIEVPRGIIEKPGPLTPREYDVAKTHAEAGYEILSALPSPWPIAEIARQHHERLDGSGYPRGLRGSEILLEAQIIAVADVVESMLADPPYRRAHALEHVLAHVRELRGTRLHAGAVDACTSLFRENKYSFPGH